MHMRRTSLVALTASLTAIGLGAAGCASAPGSQPWPRAGGGETTITILSGNDSSLSAGSDPVHKGEPGIYQQLVDWWNKYEAPEQHIRVRLDVVSGGATIAHSAMLAASEVGGTGYDIYNLDSEWVPEFAAAGYIRSLQGKLAADVFLPKPLASGKDASGRLYAAPFTTDVGLLYYRTNLGITAAQLRPLSTFDQVTSLGRDTIASHPAAGLTESYAGQFDSYEGLTVNVLEIIRGYDPPAPAPPAFASNGTVANSSAVAIGLTQLADAFSPGNADAFSPGNIPGQELNYEEAQSLSAFATGKAVFMRNWPIHYEQILAASQAGTSTVASHFAVRPLPFPSVLGGQDLAISTGSRHPAQALKVIDFLTSAEAERCLFAVGGFPATRRSAYRGGDRLPAGYRQVTDHPLCGTQVGKETTIWRVILAAIGAAQRRPVTRYYTEFSTVIQDQVGPMLKRASQGKEAEVGDVASALVADLQAVATGHALPGARG
jgi:multiple sugar transport system substrate-binding protein